jgi:hypothetical protein
MERQPCRLERMDVGADDTFIRWLVDLQTVIDLSHLRILTIWCPSEEGADLVTRLMRRLESLESLLIGNAVGALQS